MMYCACRPPDDRRALCLPAQHRRPTGNWDLRVRDKSRIREIFRELLAKGCLRRLTAAKKTRPVKLGHGVQSLSIMA